MLPILPFIAAGAAVLAIRSIRNNNRQNNEEKYQYQDLKDWFLKMKLELTEDGSGNPNARSADGVPALILAIEDKRVDIVKTLLQHGANPNAMDNKGRTALHLTGRADIIALLLKAGAEPNAQDVDGKSAIFYPHSQKSLGILKTAGADFNLRDSDGRTALFHTSSIKYAKTLIRMGCDPNIVDSDGNKAPIIITIEIQLNNELEGRIAAVDPERVKNLLEQGANPNYIPPKKHSPFMLERAIRRNSPVIAEYLLEYGAIAYPKIWNTAIFNKSLWTIKLLFKYRTPTRRVLVTVEYKNDKTLTKLFAQHVGSFGAADDKQRKMLIEAGGRIDAMDAHGRTALFYVKELDVIEPLIKAGIDPKHIDNEGKTPLFYLATDDPFNILLADELIEFGVNPVICDRNGQKAPIIQNYDKIKKQYELDRELNDAINYNALTKARDALEKGADPNCLDQCLKDWNMLMLAQYKDSPQMIKLLLDFGADPNRYDINGVVTPLTHAETNPKITDVYRQHGYKVGHSRRAAAPSPF